MTDNYEFYKSSRNQEIDEFSPYMDKQYNGFVNDLNSAVYTNTSLSLVQFDLGQIYNSQKFTDTNDLFLVLPMTYIAAWAYNNAPVTPVAGNSALITPKNNFINFIHQADLQINGKTIESTQPYINVAKNFQMLSEMSVGDMYSMGATLGFAETILDNPRSVVWNGSASTASGNGLTNNRPFVPHTAGTTGFVGTRTQCVMSSNQNYYTVNDCISQKLYRYTDTTTGGAFNNIVGNIVSSTQLANEFRPTYQVLNTNYMVWYDYVVIKLPTLLESLGAIGLVKKFDCTLRLWVNTGSMGIAISSPNTTNPGYQLTATNNTFTNTVPITVNYLPDVSTMGGIPPNTSSAVVGCYISKPPATSINGINLASSGASHPLPACRIYYSQIQLNPQKALTYVEENRNKKIIYRTVLTNQYNNIGSGNSFNQLINSGVIHPTGVLVVPFISNTATGFGDYQWKSPFDTAPSTTAPISLINFQVSIGGVNQLQSTLNYTYEHFIEQISLAEQLTSSDFGITCGLFNQQYWENFRYYFVNVERSATADKLNPRNINISFQNNSSVAVDILVFIWYVDQLTLDVETGLVKK